LTSSAKATAEATVPNTATATTMLIANLNITTLLCD